MSHTNEASTYIAFTALFLVAFEMWELAPKTVQEALCILW
jgi:hypothetical protein